MKKTISIMAALVLTFMLSVQVFAADGTLTLIKNEDFSVTTISGTTISGTNGLEATNVSNTRVTSAISSDGLGGKPETDKYLYVKRNGADNTTYFFSFNLPKGSAETNPVTVAFSVYPSEDFGETPFFVQAGLTDTTSPTGAIYFVTDKSYESVNTSGSLNEQKFFVEKGEWNRIAITMYPGTTNTDLCVNGKTYKFQQIQSTKKYGSYLRSIRLQLPSRAGVTDEFMAYDDFSIYSGSGSETYSAPKNAITSSNCLIDGDTLYVAGNFNVNDFTVADGITVCEMKGEGGETNKIACWSVDNPIPKYYNIKCVAENSFAAISLQQKGSTVVAKGFANGDLNDGGIILAAECNSENSALLNIMTYTVTAADGAFELPFEIKNYNAENVYKAFWLNSLEDFAPMCGSIGF